MGSLCLCEPAALGGEAIFGLFVKTGVAHRMDKRAFGMGGATRLQDAIAPAEQRHLFLQHVISMELTPQARIIPPAPHRLNAEAVQAVDGGRPVVGQEEATRVDGLVADNGHGIPRDVAVSNTVVDLRGRAAGRHSVKSKQLIIICFIIIPFDASTLTYLGTFFNFFISPHIHIRCNFFCRHVQYNR